MKRSEFMECLVTSFGGKQRLANGVHEALTSTTYGDNESQVGLWHLVLGLLEPDRESSPFASVLSSFIDPRPPSSALMSAIREFKQSKEFAGLGESGARATDAFLDWATVKAKEKAAETA